MSQYLKLHNILPKNALLYQRFISVSSKLMKDKPVPDEYLIMTGIERRERCAFDSGNLDPYNILPIKRKKNSTKFDPNIIKGTLDNRLVACVCDEDSFRPVHWELWYGEPQRCPCGHWFQLCGTEPL